MSTWSEQSASLLADCVAAFGVPIRYQRGSSAFFGTKADGSPLLGIFGHPNQEGTELDSQTITLDVNVADFAGTAADPVPIRGDVVAVDGLYYTVTLVQVDSENAGKLYLTETGIDP